MSTNCPRSNYLGNNFRDDNFRGSIIWAGINLGDNCPGGGDKYPGANCPGDNYPWGTIILGANVQGGQKSLRAIVWGAIIRGTIVRVAIIRGTIVGGVGNYPRGNCPVPVIK